MTVSLVTTPDDEGLVRWRMPVAIYHPSQLFRDGIKGLLERSSVTVVATGPTIAKTCLPRAVERQAAIVIFGLPSDRDLAAEIAGHDFRDPAVPRMVLLVDEVDDDLVCLAADAGIYAVLTTNVSGEVLCCSLELVALGQYIFPPLRRGKRDDRCDGRKELALSHAQLSVGRVQIDMHFSEREAQILRCLTAGASNKHIARELEVADATVRFHIRGVLRKLRVNNRTQAALWGLEYFNAFPPSALVDSRPAHQSETLRQVTPLPLA